MIYLILVSIIWGFSFIIIKGTLTSLDSNFVSLVRILLSLMVLLPFARSAGMPRADRLTLMGIGGLQFGLMYVAYVASFQYIPAHVVALLTTTTPLFVTIFNDLLRRKLHASFLAAAVLAVAGGAVIKLPEQSLTANAYGIALLQLSNAAFAFGQIAYARWMRARESLRDRDVFGYMYGGAVVVTGGFSLATTEYGRLAVEPHQWLALAYLGIIASGLCFFLWNMGARKVHAGTLAVMNNLKIPVGVLASLVILKEDTDYVRLFAGCVLFAAALGLNGRRQAKVR